MANSDVELEAGNSIGQSVQFLLSCNEKGRDLCNQRSPSIFMVPSACRDLSPTSFVPKVVSIGPLHKQNKLLQGFEDNKMAYLHRLLNRSGSSPEKMLQECMDKVSSKMNLIKACYPKSMTYNDTELARMMVIDGSFILDFIHLYNKDQIPFHDRPLTGYIINDLVLIENQIPFFVLKEIFESIFQLSESNASLTNDLCALLAEYNIFGANNSVDASADHILGILHKALQPRHKIPSSATIPKKHTAMELDRAGVNFRPNEDANSAMTMTLQLPRFSCFPWFWSKPTLKMPKLYVDDRTEMILRNLLIYEQSSIDFQYITSYASAIDMLIDTAEDVDMLEKSGVLVNGLGSNEMAADMINNICREIYFSDFLYHQEWEDLDTYYNNYWPNAVAGLKRTYFSSPWSVIALFAGIVLFVLTVIQTTFQIKAENPIIVNKQ